MNVESIGGSRPIHILLYILIPSDRACLPIHRSRLAFIRNRCRRFIELASWRLLGVWRPHHTTFKDVANSNRGDIAIRMGAKKQLLHAFSGYEVRFTEVAWGELEKAQTTGDAIDLVVIAGGGYLSADSHGRLTERFKANLEILPRFSCPIVAASIGINSHITPGHLGPFKLQEEDHALIRQFLSCLSLVSVRDQNTQQTLMIDGAQSSPIVVDPGFLLANDLTLPALPVPRTEETILSIGINVAFHGLHTAEANRRMLPIFARILKRLQSETPCRYYYFVHSDAERGVVAALRLCGISLQVVHGDVETLLSTYRKMDIHIAQMLHSAILAMSVDVPTLDLAYDIKSPGFFALFDLDHLCLDLATISEVDLYRAIQSLIAKRQAVARTIHHARRPMAEESRNFYADVASLVPDYRKAEAELGKNQNGTSISTVIPAYNAERFIARALESALKQCISHAEIIVVDDGSTDDTRSIVASYADQGVRLICHPRQSGAAAARNTGIAAATGDFVAFLDADDEWLPEKLQRQLQIITENPDMIFVSCRATLVDEHGHDEGDLYKGAPAAVGDNAWRTLLTYPCVATPSVVVRRNALLMTGGFNKWLPVGEDQDMWIRLSFMGEVGHLPQALVRVHSTPNSLSKTNFRDQASYVLPMITAYIARNEKRLAPGEKRRILGERYGKIGKSAYANGEFAFGLIMLFRAMGLGHQPSRNFLYLIRASGIVQRLKRWLHRSAHVKRPAAV